MAKKYLRKQGVADRYSVSVRSVERMSRDGRIDPPVYLPGSTTPLWDEEALDAGDRRATLGRLRPPPPTEQPP